MHILTPYPTGQTVKKIIFLFFFFLFFVDLGILSNFHNFGSGAHFDTLTLISQTVKKFYLADLGISSNFCNFGSGAHFDSPLIDQTVKNIFSRLRHFIKFTATLVQVHILTPSITQSPSPIGQIMKKIFSGFSYFIKFPATLVQNPLQNSNTDSQVRSWNRA